MHISGLLICYTFLLHHYLLCLCLLVLAFYIRLFNSVIETVVC